MAQMRFAESYAETVNYKYWSVRSDAESRDDTKAARQAMYLAEEQKRNSIFDDEFQYDPVTGEKKLKKKGAITLFEEAFDMWNAVLDDPDVPFDILADGEIIDDLMESAGEYWDMLRVTGRDWPEDFVFQDIIDARAVYGEDKLPTSQEVQDRISGQTEIDTDDPVQPDAIKPGEEDEPLPAGIRERSQMPSETDSNSESESDAGAKTDSGIGARTGNDG